MARGRFFAVGSETFAAACGLGLNPAAALLVLARGSGPDNAMTRWSAQAAAGRLGVRWSTARAAIGVLAAAGIVALTAMVERLADDHRRAAALARRLAAVSGLAVDLAAVQTNIVLASTLPAGVPAGVVAARLAQRGVLALARPPHGLRFVTHHRIGDGEVERAAAMLAAVMAEVAAAVPTAAAATAATALGGER